MGSGNPIRTTLSSLRSDLSHLDVKSPQLARPFSTESMERPKVHVVDRSSGFTSYQTSLSWMEVRILYDLYLFDC